MIRAPALRGRIGAKWTKRVWNDFFHGAGLHQYSMMRVLADGRQATITRVFTQRETRANMAISLREARRELAEFIRAVS